MLLTCIQYQIIDKFGNLKGYGNKSFKGGISDNTIRKVNTFKRNYNKSHKNYKMEIVGSNTYSVPKNTKSSSKYFKVK